MTWRGPPTTRPGSQAATETTQVSELLETTALYCGCCPSGLRFSKSNSAFRQVKPHHLLRIQCLPSEMAMMTDDVDVGFKFEEFSWPAKRWIPYFLLRWKTGVTSKQGQNQAPTTLVTKLNDNVVLVYSFAQIFAQFPPKDLLWLWWQQTSMPAAWCATASTLTRATPTEPGRRRPCRSPLTRDGNSVLTLLGNENS